MDKRYQVFVSSTFTDLEEERRHIIQTLMEMDCIPAGMELFPAVDEDQWEFIKKVIDDCDYYLLLIGGRYGSISSEGISYTEKEYDYAVAKGMKVIALIHGDVDNLPQIKCEKDPILQKKLEVFRDKVKTGRVVKFWKNADQIAGLVSLSLSKTIKTYPAIGWVRANLVSTEAASQEILNLRNKIKDLEIKIEKLTTRPEGLENLSQGEDFFYFNYSFKAFNQDDNFKKYYLHNACITWNQVFKFLSPHLIVESSENELIEIFNNNSPAYFLNDLKITLNERGFYEPSEFAIERQDFNKLVIQLRALKLIKLSERKHATSDNNVYWSLTPYGDQLMTELNAIKKTS